MSNRSSIFEKIIEPGNGGFSAEHARYVLSLSVPREDQERYAELSEKAQSGTLTSEETALLDEYLNTNAILIILKSKARMSLRQHGSAA